MPFLWILPLSLYLLTFILCFDSDRWYVRPLFALALLAWGDREQPFNNNGWASA